MKRPYWLAEITDEKWCARVRREYEDAAGMDDEKIREEYANGNKFAVLWDHLGDAYEDYESLAEAYLKLLAECGKTVEDDI